MPDAATPFPAAPAHVARAPGAGETAARLAGALSTGDLLFVATDEQRAERIAAMLAEAASDAVVVHLPSSDALPGETAPGSPANIGCRVSALRRLRTAGDAPGRARLALVTTAEAAARLYPAPEEFDPAPPALAVDQPIDLEALAETLEGIGYVRDERVDEPGEIGARGQVIDVFPADADGPVRIEVADGKVAGLRDYDPVTQLATGERLSLELGRACEPELGEGVPLFAHLPGAAVAIEAGAIERRDRYLALVADAAKRARGGERAITAQAWNEAVAGRDPVDLVADVDLPPRFVEGRSPMRALAAFARGLAEGERLVIAGGARDLRFLRPRLAKALKADPVAVASWAEAATAGAPALLTMAIERGFRIGDTVVVAAADLLGSRAETDQRARTAANPLLGEHGDIRVGDVVVHEDHGLGVVLGLEPMPDAAEGDAILLGYAGDDRRLVPVADADRIWRYGADREAVTLDKLDGTSWAKRRGEIDRAIAEGARELSRLAAERAERTAPVLAPDVAAYERFASGFPFTETADQARAIEAVVGDLASGKPMDRLVIGDVGYGKTEVALRAAAVAALAGAQVAIAAPTTVLARQHLETFTKRFEGTGIQVAGLSRLSSAAEKKRVRAGLADGSIGVVIGTGAVAGKGVAYKNLALVVIDEEQRFGKADKDRLRGLGAGHVLTLSATPIPRTLQMALVGLQQMSVIAMPPARRQPISTSVGNFDDQVIRTALMREKARGGQSFVVVPRIEDMAPLAARLAKLVSELEVLQAHGKLPAEEIDDAMVRFGGGGGDVLLATNIIEAGLDVPRANTMIVWRADRFGLSQLHQLRGRVGRGGRRGQVLLMTDPDSPIADATLKRLRTLQAFDRLGAGFAISARDLDMRGAGDLVGEAQAGHMKLVGIDLYQHLLGSALRAARGEEVERWTPELHLGVAGSLPESWVPEAELRVTLYGRLSRLEDGAALDAFEAELEDRFGALPDEAALLLRVARARVLARAANIARIDAGPGAIAFTPRRDFAGSADGLEEKDGRLLLKERIEDAGERLERVVALLEELAGET